MIDEKKLIEEIKSLQVTVNGLRAGKGILREFEKQYRESILRIIEAQPKVGEWIPYSERLPEKTGYYLVQLSRKLPNEDYADRIVVLYNGEDKEFMTYKRLIVAWMPLPEPYSPKGE